MLRFGYISNGFADHSLEQMIQVLERVGYQGIGITLDHHHLDPFKATPEELDALRDRLKEARLEPVIETGARYFLDAFRKHRPSLLSVEPLARRRRVIYYKRAIEVAKALGASVVSLWSGVPQERLAAERCWVSLVDGLREVLDHAQEHGVVIGFEPEPGMFVESMAHFDELKERIPHPALGLTLDLGHVTITEEPPFEGVIERYRDSIVNVHIEDIRNREHVHLPFGDGEIDFPPLLAKLKEIGYRGVVQVELSRHSPEAPHQAQRSLVFLRGAEGA